VRSGRRKTLAARPILIAQISDLHITRPGALAYGRVDTAACLQASQPVSVRPASRPSLSNSNHAGRKFSESTHRPSICTHGFPDRDSEAWLLTLCRSGSFRGPKQPHPRCKAQFLGKAAALSSVTFSAYIPSCRGNPAMAINGRRNKPIGPGGSTRRLHQSLASTGFGGGEIGSTRV